MRVVIRFRRGWWLACLEGCGVEFAMDTNFGALIRRIRADGYVIVGIERRG